METDYSKTNAMGVTSYTWGSMVQNEADKCWFYAITFSILLSLYRFVQVFFVRPSPSNAPSKSSSIDKEETSKEPPEQSATRIVPYRPLLTRLAIDCCDLTIPGSSLGWIPVQLYIVGAAQFTSSALAGLQIWRRVQSHYD